MEEVAVAEQDEKLLFQYIMDYRAYRRKMFMTRITIAAVLTGGLFGLCAIRVWLGIIFGTMAAFAGAIFVIVALHHEETYMIFDTRFVIKHDDKRASVPLDSMTEVTYKRTFYERDIATGTITIKAADAAKGRNKKYRMKHVFNAREGVAFLKGRIRNGKSGTENVK